MQILAANDTSTAPPYFKLNKIKKIKKIIKDDGIIM